MIATPEMIAAAYPYLNHSSDVVEQALNAALALVPDTLAAERDMTPGEKIHQMFKGALKAPENHLLAAEREAGRKAGLEEAAKVAEDSQDHRPQNPYAGSGAGQIQRQTCQDVADAIRALCDTPAAPVEGGAADE